jgi:hypothetical protein
MGAATCVDAGRHRKLKLPRSSLRSGPRCNPWPPNTLPVAKLFAEAWVPYGPAPPLTPVHANAPLGANETGGVDFCRQVSPW